MIDTVPVVPEIAAPPARADQPSPTGDDSHYDGCTRNKRPLAIPSSLGVGGTLSNGWKPKQRTEVSDEVE